VSDENLEIIYKINTSLKWTLSPFKLSSLYTI
jgi:hypothetical protein